MHRNEYIEYITSYTSYVLGNGGWSNWIKNSTCTVECGGGIQAYTRRCTNPSPNEIGTSCAGESYNKEVCNEDNCFGKFDRLK